MRYFLFNLGLLLLVASCKSKTKLTPEELMEQKNKQTALRFLEVFNQGKTELLDSIVAVDYVDHTGGENGLEGYKRSVKATRSAFPDIQFQYDDVVADSNKVFIRYTWDATHTKPFLGIDSTGKKITVNGMGLLRFENGKLVERWNVTDMYDLAEQLKSKKMTF